MEDSFESIFSNGNVQTYNKNETKTFLNSSRKFNGNPMDVFFFKIKCFELCNKILFQIDNSQNVKIFLVLGKAYETNALLRYYYNVIISSNNVAIKFFKEVI